MGASSPRGQTLPRLRRSGHAEQVTTENHGNSGPVQRALRTMASAVVDRAFCDALTEANRVACGKPKDKHVSPVSPYLRTCRLTTRVPTLPRLSAIETLIR